MIEPLNICNASPYAPSRYLYPYASYVKHISNTILQNHVITTVYTIRYFHLSPAFSHSLVFFLRRKRMHNRHLIQAGVDICLL